LITLREPRPKIYVPGISASATDTVVVTENGCGNLARVARTPEEPAVV
jgi:hypothetical protein